MTPDLYFAVPGDLATRTGGYEYDRQLIAALRARGIRVESVEWPGQYPFPTPSDRAVAAQSLAALPDGTTVLVDGLAFGALPDVARHAAARLRFVALVHHPLALETGMTEADRTMLAASETEALRHAAAIVVTSRSTAATLVQSFGVAADRITVALPGTAVPATVPRTTRHAVRLLSVGSVVPRKGYGVLLAALAQCMDLAWTCRIVGSRAFAPAEAERIAALRDELGVQGRVRMEGEVADTGPFYRRADVFVLASRYEGYGMAYAEAIAHGLPVIGTTGGAIPEVVPAAAGILVPPDDDAALARALRDVIGDPALRARLTAGAVHASGSLPRWADAAARVAALLGPGRAV
ncbi:MAG: glycosyltransferase family 4 protein [Gemmatimonadaceae bacterium]|nr:glycosyltransferase family 4 protein [Acetobacteraceae bacterium]